MNNDVLVIKVNMDVSAETLHGLYEGFKLQRKNGVVVIPSFCDVLMVPGDTKIKVKGISDVT